MSAGKRTSKPCTVHFKISKLWSLVTYDVTHCLHFPYRPLNREHNICDQMVVWILVCSDSCFILFSLGHMLVINVHLARLTSGATNWTGCYKTSNALWGRSLSTLPSEDKWSTADGCRFCLFSRRIFKPTVLGHICSQNLPLLYSIFRVSYEAKLKQIYADDDTWQQRVTTTIRINAKTVSISEKCVCHHHGNQQV